MNGRMHTEEEKKWALDKTSSVSEITPKVVREFNLIAEYKQKFGREMPLPSFVNWLKKTRWPEKFGYQAYKKKMKKATTVAHHRKYTKRSKQATNLADPAINFLLFVGNTAVGAFHTEQEVKAFCFDAQPNNLRIFKSVSHTIKYTVEL